VSFFVKDDSVFTEKGTRFPVPCPDCPAYLPLLPEATKQTIIKCWNCGLTGTVEFFIEDEPEFEFVPTRLH